MLSFSGTDAPADDMEVMVMGESVATFGVSTMAPGFQGFLEATCEFRNGERLCLHQQWLRLHGRPHCGAGLSRGRGNCRASRTD